MYTGSYVFDETLSGEFPGESRRDWSTVAVKVHYPKIDFLKEKCKPLSVNDTSQCSTKRVVLIIRHPFSASVADFKRFKTQNHTGEVDIKTSDEGERSSTYFTITFNYFLNYIFTRDLFVS